MFRTKEGALFLRDTAAIYKDLQENKRVTIFNFTKKVPPQTCFNYSANRKSNDSLLNSLTFKLIYIRFKVPYDDMYRYETFGYIFEKKEEESDPTQTVYRWESLTDLEKMNLINSHYEFIANEKDEDEKKDINEFLIDFKDNS